jgi:hypothetical protein
MRAKRYRTLQVSVCLALITAFPMSGAVPGVNAQTAPSPSRPNAAATRELVKARLAQSIAAVDLNNDGFPDVVTTDFLRDALLVHMARPAGGFEAAVSVPVGRGPRSLVAADLDGDGRVDLAVGEFFEGAVRLLHGRGDGSFEEAASQRLGAGISSLAAADFDGDGITDLAAANALSGEIVLLRNGAGGSLAASPLGRTDAPTLLLPVTGSGTGSDLAAIGADGLQARLFTARAMESTAAPLSLEVSAALAAAGNRQALTAAVRSRVAKAAGDGQVTRAGSGAAEPLMLDVHDAAGAPAVGAAVAFVRIAGGAGLSEPGRAEESGTTGADGRIAVSLQLPDNPDVSLIAAVVNGDQIEHFGVVAAGDNEQIGEALAAAIAGGTRDGRARTASMGHLQQALRLLRDGDSAGAIADLAAISLAASGTQGAEAVSDLSRRFIHQLLLIGALGVDTDELVCDVTLIRTIETMTETDAFTLPGTANETIYVVMTNEGGASGFNPVWRLLLPGGAPHVGCGGFSTAARDCTLPSNGTYTLEVADSGQNATGTYGIQVQRLTDGRRCGDSIACDVAKTKTIGGRADTDLYSFTSVALETVHISTVRQGGTTAFLPVWRLLLPDGTPAPACGAYSSADRNCTLGMAGSYAIQVADSGHDTAGTYGLHVQHLTDARRCGGTITCNVSSSHTLGGVNTADTNLHSFSGTANERLYIVLTNDGGTAFTPIWRLVAPDGTPSSSCGSFTTAPLDCVLAVSGSYAIEVMDSGLDGTGTYGLQVQRLTAGQRCDGATIACDTPVSTTIDARADTNLHSFTGVAGERVHIGVSDQGGGAAFAPFWRLLLPDGTVSPVCGSFSPSNRDCSIGVAGSYAIHVADSSHDSTGTYGLYLQNLTAERRCGGTTDCNVTTSNTVGSVNTADTNLHSFAGVANEKIYVIVTNEGGTAFTPVWRLIAPDGTPATGCGSLTTAFLDCTLATTGSYAVEVLDSFLDGSGTYGLQIQRLTAGRRCDAGSITCDTPVSLSVGTGGRADSNLHSFTAVAGEIVHITIANLGGAAGFAPFWRLLQPDGAPASGCSTFYSADRDCTLAVAGSYALHVADGSHDSSGTYGIHLQNLKDTRRCGGSIACDVPLSNTIGTVNRADTNLHSFSGVANERVYVLLRNDGGTLFTPVWRMLGPSGAPVSGCGGYTTAALDCTLPTSGSYAIEVVDANVDGSGTYGLHIQRLTASQRCGDLVPCGTPFDSTLGMSNRADSNLHSFSGTAGQAIPVTFTNLGGTLFNPAWRLVMPDGAPATSAACGTFSTATRTCTLAVSGSYAIHVTDISTDGSGSYRLDVDCTGLLPDLYISALGASAKTCVGSSVTIKPKTANKGSGSSGPTLTRVFLSNNNSLDGGDVQLGSDYAVPGLAPGTFKQGSQSVTIPATSLGQKFLIAVADAAGTESETNEGNNTFAKKITIGPDLSISGFTAPATASAGATISVTVVTKNVGGCSTPATTTRLYFSNDNSVDGGDPFQNIAVAGLAPNDSQTNTVSVTIPAGTAPGKRFLIAVADAGGAVAESKEANTKKKAITIE